MPDQFGSRISIVVYMCVSTTIVYVDALTLEAGQVTGSKDIADCLEINEHGREDFTCAAHTSR